MEIFPEVIFPRIQLEEPLSISSVFPELMLPTFRLPEEDFREKLKSFRLELVWILKLPELP